MEIKPSQLIAFCVVIFGGIVAINLASQARSDEILRSRLSSLPDLASLTNRLKREEMMIPEQGPEQIALYLETTKETTKED